MRKLFVDAKYIIGSPFKDVKPGYTELIIKSVVGLLGIVYGNKFY